MGRLLEVRNLQTSFFTYTGECKAVRGVSFHVDEGEAIALVGESGCGKSMTAMSIMRLVPSPPGKILGGEVLFDGKDLLKVSAKDMRKIRGKEIGMIFQDPMTSLNPVITIGRQISEVLTLHEGLKGKAAMDRTIELLQMVGIPSPETRIRNYPHQFSGGMRQRVMIAMALACNPRLLIADEPTTALDVTIQAQIIDLMEDLKQRLNTSIILITHDLGVVAKVCSRVIVMYAGRIVEEGPVDDIFHNPQHPYTIGLLKSAPRLDETEKRKLVPIEGQPPDLISPPTGCVFNPRCNEAMKICLQEEPEVTSVTPHHRVACWLREKRRLENSGEISKGVVG